MHWQDIRLENGPPDVLVSVQVFRFHFRLLSNRLGPSITNGQNTPRKVISDTHRLGALFSFPNYVPGTGGAAPTVSIIVRTQSQRLTK